MLDYKELSLNPYHLNRNQEATEESKVAPPDYMNWWDLLGAGASSLADYYKYQGPTSEELAESISPLEQAYSNLYDMAQQYRDPASELNVANRAAIRNRNLEATTDLIRRAANQAQGTVDDSMATKGIGSIAMQTAIANALESYNQEAADRLKMASDYDAKAAAAAHTLATARQQNLMLEQQKKKQQAGVAGDLIQNIYDWGKMRDPNLGWPF